MAMTSNSRELLTIQCGHYSNFVGTHWWNLQEAGQWYPPLQHQENQKDEIDSDCMFREGITITGRETYTPRLISLDLSGSLSSLNQVGSLYETHDGDNLGGTAWKGNTEQLITTPNKKNEFVKDLESVDTGVVEEEVLCGKEYDLDSSVKVWSDFLRPHLHPNTLITIPGFFHDDDRFDVWPSGIDVWSNKQFRTKMEDRLHFFMEECDAFQGFQIMFDQCHSGFSALNISLLEYLHDEYTNKPIVSFAVTPPCAVQRKPTKIELLQHTMDSLLTIPNVHEYSSLLVPLSLSPSLWPFVSPPPVLSAINYTPQLPYHTSAILSSALETVTSCYRSPLYRETISSVCGLLSQNGRKVSSLALSLPVCLPNPSELNVDSFRSVFDSSLCLSPHCDSSNGLMWNQSIGIRGYPLRSSVIPSSSQDIYSKLIHSLYDIYQSTNSQLSLFGKPLIPNSPFPSIVNFEQPTKHYKTVASFTALQSHSGIHGLFNALLSQAEKSNVSLIPPCYSSCLDRDTYMELMCSLRSISDTYTVGSPIECSSDEDN